MSYVPTLAPHQIKQPIRDETYYNIGFIIICSVFFIPSVVFIIKLLYKKRYKRVIAYPIPDGIYISTTNDIEINSLPVAIMKPVAITMN